MKKKIFGIVLSVVIILTLGLVLPVSASALPPAVQGAGVIIAERLLETQNNDGGWEWSNSDSDPATGVPSPYNTLGVTALGLLDMYKLTGESSYLTACENTYNALFANSTNPNTSVHKIRGTDITFLVELSEVTCVSTYADFAKIRWENNKTEFGGGTATGFAQYVRDLRVGQGWGTLVAWDINLSVQGLESLNRYFPEDGYSTEASDMALVICDYLYSDVFPVNDTQDGYWLTVTGATETLASTGANATALTSLVTELVSSQDISGYFNNLAVADIQTTAYAVMALLKAGSYDSAKLGVDYLVANVDSYPIIGGDTGNSEANSEIAQAIYDLILATPLNINTTSGIGGLVNPSGDVSVSYGHDQVFSIVPDVGYHIADVQVDGISEGIIDNYTFTGVIADHAISASFAINSYTLTINAVGGTVTKIPEQASYDYGTSVTLQATPDSGFNFSGWSGDLTGGSNPITLIMDSNKNITAGFYVPANSGGGGGGGNTPTDTNILGKSGEIHQNYKGETLKEFTVTNGELTVNIPKGTVMKDKNGNSLTKINVKTDSTSYPEPENGNVVGLQYNFTPNGAQFNPAMNLTFKYSDADIPAGVNENDLKIAYYDTVNGKWIELECVVDAVNNTIMAKVSHFTTFAVIGINKPLVTHEPTIEPTIEPTVEPIVEPTVEPTIEPTKTIAPTPDKTTTSPTTVPPNDDNKAKIIVWGIIGAIIVLIVVVVIINRKKK